MLPIHAVRALRFADARLGDFLIEENDGPFIVGGIADDLYAIFLKGTYAGHAIKLEREQPRTGIALSGLSLEVDHTSWTTDLRTPRAVIGGEGAAMMIAQTKIGPWDEAIRVGLFAPAPPGAQATGMAAFTRWALAYRDKAGGRQVIYERTATG